VTVETCDGLAEIDCGIDAEPEGEDRRDGKCDVFRTSVTMNQLYCILS
jgi:hypothetical protein